MDKRSKKLIILLGMGDKKMPMDNEMSEKPMSKMPMKKKKKGGKKK